MVRSSLLNLFQGLDKDLASNPSPQYANANIKINIPTKKTGTFSIFGIGGVAELALRDEYVDTVDLFLTRGYNVALYSKLGLVGANHLYYFNDKTSLKTTVSYFVHDYHDNRDTILNDGRTQPHYLHTQFYDRIGVASIFNRKQSSRFSIRTGIEAYLYQYQLHTDYLQQRPTLTYAQERYLQANAFIQAQYKFSKRFEILFGLQGMYWSLNDKSWTIEPRTTLTYNLATYHRLSFSYGLHSKIPPASILFNAAYMYHTTNDGSNKELGLLHSHNLVLSYDWIISKYWLLEANVYAFYQTDIPVESTSSSYSILNNGSNGTSLFRNELVNEGEGYNYGAEVSLERFMGKGYYGLVSASYQRSFYKASDQVWRHTAFDVRYIASIMGGKEFKIGPKQRNIFHIDLRFTTHGGLPYIPINLEASKRLGYQVLDMERAFSDRGGAYNRLDFRTGIRLNHHKKQISHHIYLEILNLLNFENEAGQSYYPEQERIAKARQFGIVPNMTYRIRF